MVLDEALTKESKYEEVDPLSHIFYRKGQRKVYGLEFARKEDAQTFKHAVHVALKSLCSGNPGMSLLIDQVILVRVRVFPIGKKHARVKWPVSIWRENEKAIVILQWVVVKTSPHNVADRVPLQSQKGLAIVIQNNFVKFSFTKSKIKLPGMHPFYLLLNA